MTKFEERTEYYRRLGAWYLLSVEYGMGLYSGLVVGWLK